MSYEDPYQKTSPLLSHFSCVRLCVTPEGSPPGSPIPGILQARTLEWVAISLSNAGKWKMKMKSLSRVQLLATPWTAAHQAPPSMGFSRQEYWSGSRLAITFLPRSKCLLISWLQSASVVVLEPPQIKCITVHCFPICLLWSDETRCHDLSFLNVVF